MFDPCVDPFIPNDTENNNSVVLIVNGDRFPCNKVSLQNASAYFQAMFNSSMLESTAKEIEIRDVDSTVFKALLDYAHTNVPPTFAVNENDFSSTCELLQAACIFQFDDVSRLCCDFLTAVLNSTNCLKIWEIADALCLPDLHSKSRSQALWFGDQMLQSEEIFNVSFERFVELISDDTLQVQTESCIFNCIMKWIQENELEDKQALQLLTLVRAKDLLRSERHLIMCHPFVLSHGNSLLQDIQELEEEDRDQPLCFHRHEWRSRGATFKPLLYGYSFHGRKNKLNIHLYVQGEMCFTELTSICVFFKTLVGFGVCIVGKDVYMFGGREKVHFGRWNQQMWKYDTLKGKWSVLAQVPFCRRHFRCLVLANKIYILGGFGEYRVAQTTMLCFNTDTGEWTECMSPPSCSYSPSVATGLYQTQEVLYYFTTSVYVYLPQDDVWKEISNSSMVNGLQQAIEYGGYIYLMVQDLYANGAKIYMYDTSNDELDFVGSSLSEDCVSFAILNGSCYIYTDNGIEIISLPSGQCAQSSQVMFRWRNEQQKPLNAPLKYVGLIPHYT